MPARRQVQHRVPPVQVRHPLLPRPVRDPADRHLPQHRHHRHLRLLPAAPPVPVRPRQPRQRRLLSRLRVQGQLQRPQPDRPARFHRGLLHLSQRPRPRRRREQARHLHHDLPQPGSHRVSRPLQYRQRPARHQPAHRIPFHRGFLPQVPFSHFRTVRNGSLTHARTRREPRETPQTPHRKPGSRRRSHTHVTSCLFLQVQRHIDPVTRTRPAPMAALVVPVVRECAVVRRPGQAAGRRRGACMIAKVLLLPGV